LAVAPGARPTFEEGVQAVGREVGDRGQSDAPRPAVSHLDRPGDQQLALARAPAAARRVVLDAAGDRGLVDLDQAGERRPAGRDRGAAQLGAQQPGGLVGAQAELLCSCRAEMPLEWVAIR
jgi:hypothetical protein